MRLVALAAALLLAAPLQAKLAPPAFKPPTPSVDAPNKVLRLQVTAESAGTEHSADFLVENGNQANYVQGGEKSFPVETKAGAGVEFKKWGFIVNALPVEDPAHPGAVSVQLQIEVSGPAKDSGDVRTWQLQTTLHVTKGRPKTVSRGAGKLVLTVSDDADDGRP